MFKNDISVTNLSNNEIRSENGAKTDFILTKYKIATITSKERE